MAVERRKHIRSPSYLGGRVAFNHLYASADCLIRNISPAGARLVFAETPALPAHFTLAIQSREQTLNARVAWRDERNVGVVFETAESVRPVPLDMARRIRRLEDEKKKLQQRVDELSNVR